MSSSSSPLVTALVLNYRTPQETVGCVGALLRQALSPPPPLPAGRGGVGGGEGLEILVIDNHSEDDSIGVLRNRLRRLRRVDNGQWTTDSSSPLSSVRIIETPRNLGYGKGNNFARRFIHGKYILIINPDNELEPDALQKMVEVMETDPSIGIIAPKLIHEDGTIRDSYRSFPTITDVFIKRTALRHLFPERMRQYLQWGASTEQPRTVDWVVGACMLLRRELYEELGGFDPRFFLFFEDTDLCRRSAQLGKRVVYFPPAVATDRKHRLSEGGLLSPLLKKTVRMHLVSAVKYFWKWA